MFLQNIDQLIAQKHLLNHPFYRAWSEGKLSLAVLKEYAKEYYHHVKAFPTYLSALHSRMESGAERRQVLQNLIEEEAGSPNHPDLWRQFAFSLGVTPEELESHLPNEEMKTLIATFRESCSVAGIGEAIATLYAYESQIPPICLSKIQGLKEHYNLKDPQGWAYFSVHIAADTEHAAQERALLAPYESQAESIYAATERALDVLWNFLSGLCHRHQIVCN